MAQPKMKRVKVNHDTNGNELSIGRPKYRPSDGSFTTDGGIQVTRKVETIKEVVKEVEKLVDDLDTRRGCIFESAYEYPGRYARWTMGFCDPPLALESRDLEFRISALNARGKVLLPWFENAIRGTAEIVPDSFKVVDDDSGHYIIGKVVEMKETKFTEEERSKQPSVFSILRRIVDLWKTETSVDPQLGLYGAFGYDLTFQFDSVKMHQDREANERDLLMYIPDSVLVYDKQAREAWRILYDFSVGDATTSGIERTGTEVPFEGSTHVEVRRDHEKGEFAESVSRAKKEFECGNLFEVVLSQTFFEPCPSPPSEVFRRLRKRNPSPYMFIINLGEKEYLVGASPEMFVRVEQTPGGMRVETCPISGTIRRGNDALEDADRIREILVNRKEESELTMCTDVDRNDKSRICRPGSVQVIGRRQIEKYSKLIHTVDHVEGYLRDGFDALDAFLVHTWAVTVTGSPKTWAKAFVEKHEKSARCWYGGAVGLIGFDGGLNTGLTLRTIRLKEGVAQIRAGATLLYDSVPEAEEAETELKASAFREAVLHAQNPADIADTASMPDIANDSMHHDKKVLLIDHDDSFVQTLANYFRQTGAEVSTVRWGISKEDILEYKPDLVCMSPGPGNPKDFKCSETIRMLIEEQIPIFGVCLGLQALVEYFGGDLAILPYPMHGKPSTIKTKPGPHGIFRGLPEEFTVARYHSLYAEPSKFPSEHLDAVAMSVEETPIIMAIEHKTMPIAALQFHPESILTNPKHGLTILKRALQNLKSYDD